MNNLRDRIHRNNTLKLIIIIASLVLPIVSLFNMIGSADNGFLVFFNWLWIGFYSTIFAILFLEKNIWIILLIIINIGIIIFALIASFLAGIPGLLYMIIKILVPLIPDQWIGIELRP